MASQVKRKLQESSSSPIAAKVPRSVATFFSAKAKPVVEKKFDKEKWIQSLSNEQKELLKLEIDTLDESWLAVLYPELTKPYFLNLKQFLDKEAKSGKTIFPPRELIYSWSRLTPLDQVKVVILGQDPYHNFNQAHGLAFSVLEPTLPPPSLRNIYIALKKDYPEFSTIKTKKGTVSGDLTLWAKRGVLLLNSCLTVRAHEANSHANHGWETFTDAVLLAAAENKQKRGICFMAWGSPAGKRVDKIPHKQNHLILKSVHPSPLSASRGFFDCHHFKLANQWLREKYGVENGPIDWSLDPLHPLVFSK